MNTIFEHFSCPDYQFDKLDLNKVSQCLDKEIIDRFAGKEIIVRGIQSEKHNSSKEQIVKNILETGTDRHDQQNNNEVRVSDRPIDLFGYACIAKSPITLSVLEGFHKWKPKCLERPQRRVDIWMIYDASQLNNVEYNHGYYDVRASDGYTFKDPSNKLKSLIGVFVID